MSYEGYTQYLCKNGHYFAADCNDCGDKKCPSCGEPIAWWNSVDETNGSFDIDEHGNETDLRIDNYVELEEAAPAEYCTCKDCGNTHKVKPATYKIPTDRGHVGAESLPSWIVQ